MPNIIPAHPLQSRHNPAGTAPNRLRARRSAPLLSPTLIGALKGLAKVEDLTIATLIAVLINEALDRRLHRSRRP